MILLPVPTPGYTRAMQTVIDALRAAGHECVPFEPPRPFDAIQVLSGLLTADGGYTVTNVRYRHWKKLGGCFKAAVSLA